MVSDQNTVELQIRCLFCCTTLHFGLNIEIIFTMWRVQYCHSKSSIRLSICNVEVSWSHRLEFFKSNFTVS